MCTNWLVELTNQLNWIKKFWAIMGEKQELSLNLSQGKGFRAETKMSGGGKVTSSFIIIFLQWLQRSRVMKSRNDRENYRNQKEAAEVDRS